MNRWLVYLRERFPVLTYGALVAGISLSGIYLNKGTFHWIPFVLSFVGIFLFFALLRLMDEVKDYEKDKIAHKDRPLPRGLIKKNEAVRLIDVMQVILFAFSLVVWVVLQSVAALAYAVIAIYLWMMYKEFGLGKWLSRHPFLYGITHQLIVFPVAMFAVAVVSPGAVFAPATWELALMFFGAFFCYEICRKLDPHTHPILTTYVQFYGFRRTYEVTVLLLAISAMSAIMLGLVPLLIPCEIIVLVVLSLLFFQASWYRVPEVTASISLMAHVWAVVINTFFHL